MDLWQFYMLLIVVLLAIGVYCLIARRNLIQLIIGLEVIAKAVTLMFVLAGSLQSNEQIAQSIVITIILIEAIIAAVAISLIVVANRHAGSLDMDIFRRLRG